MNRSKNRKVIRDRNQVHDTQGEAQNVSDGRRQGVRTLIATKLPKASARVAMKAAGPLIDERGEPNMSRKV